MLNHNVLYIEPIAHVQFQCHVVSKKGRTIASTYSSEELINELLIDCYAASLKSRKKYTKRVHNIHRLAPIIIDDIEQFVMIPLTASKNRNGFWLNLGQLLRFEKKGISTCIHFRDDTHRELDVDIKFCETQYRKALEILDYYSKYKEMYRTYRSY